MSTNAIARRYAKALVQLAADEGRVEAYKDELASFEAVVTANRDLAAIFRNPAYAIETKREIMKELTGRLGVSTTVSSFLLLLLDRSRLDQLSPIIASYGALADGISGVVRPTLTTAFPLDDGQVDQIRGALAKTTGRQVVLTVEVDPALIGGVVAKIGDKVFDGSVKTQLQRIEDTLQKG